MMTPEEIGKQLKEKFGDSVQDLKLDVSQPWAQVAPEHIVEVCTYLRDDPNTSFDFLRSQAAVDYKEEFEVVYLLFSYSKRHAFKLKVRVPRDKPNIPTVENVWPAANWYEREAFDLMGVHFDGHSELRRIMLPEDWVGHPLRKDYKEKESYRGVGTQREYLTGMPKLPTLPPEPE